MKFKQLNEQEISDFIINDPKLAYMGFSDTELTAMYQNKKYPLAPGSYYVGIEDDKELIAILKWEAFTEITLNIHLYIASKYHGKGVLKDVYKFLYSHFLKETNIKKLLIMSPDCCPHTCKAAVKMGFKLQAQLANTMMWRQQLVGINIYSLDIEGKE